MSSRIIAFPTAPPHTMLQGGQDMEFKHTHPAYEDARKREEKLRDTQSVCLAAIAALRMKEAQRGA